MAKVLNEPGLALLNSIPELADIFARLEEGAREATAMQRGGAGSVGETYNDLVRDEGNVALIRAEAAKYHQEPDPDILNAALRKVERSRTRHQNAQPSAIALTKTSSDREKTREKCVTVLNEFGLSGGLVRLERPSIPKDGPSKTAATENKNRGLFRAELRDISLAQPTLNEDLADTESVIAALEVTGANEPRAVWVGGHPELRFSMRAINAEPDLPGRIPVQVDAIPLLVSLFPDEIRERAFRQVRDFHASTPEVLRLGADVKARRIADLKAKIAASERLECACILALAGDSPALHFPPDVSAFAILGLSGLPGQLS